MATLLLRLQGPMQSWGTQSRFRYRDTGLEPSKSGVIGLLCAALGRPRWESLDDLVGLRMGARADREGVLRLDYHTVGARYVAGRLPGAQSAFPPTGRPENGIISHRYYLADAAFLVALEGDLEILQSLHSALADPTWHLCLGRKAFPPGESVRLIDGLTDQPIEGMLTTYPRLAYARGPASQGPVRIVLDAEDGTEVRNDVPLSFAERTFASRRVRTYWKEI